MLYRTRWRSTGRPALHRQRTPRQCCSSSSTATRLLSFDREQNRCLAAAGVPTIRASLKWSCYGGNSSKDLALAVGGGPSSVWKRLRKSAYTDAPARLGCLPDCLSELMVLFRWLADQGQLQLAPDATSTAEHSGPTAALLTALLRGGYRIEVYSTFAMLSELGYIVRTRPRPASAAGADPRAASHGTETESRPAKRQRFGTSAPCESAGAMPGGAGENAELDTPAAAAPHAALGPHFVHLDVFAPDKSFRRSAPGTPHYVVSVCAADCSSPSATQVRQLAASEKGSTLLHAVASGAEVQLLSLAPRFTDEFDLRESS